MDWISLLTAILGYFTAKKSGVSTAGSLAIGAAAGLATHYLVSPTNPEAKFYNQLWGDGTVNKTVAGAAGASAATAAVAGDGTRGALGVVTDGVTSITKHAIDNPAKTVGLIAGGAAVANTDWSSIKKFIPWILVIGGAYFVLKD